MPFACCLKPLCQKWLALLAHHLDADGISTPVARLEIAASRREHQCLNAAVAAYLRRGRWQEEIPVSDETIAGLD